MDKTISIVIRTLNEERYLEELFRSIINQKLPDGVRSEVVLVDSGSTDHTLVIAQRYEAKIVHIAKEDFTFGRSLNVGCDAASGEYLVFISGHCVPVDNNWLYELVKPLMDGKGEYSYGRQVAGPTTKFSEGQLFAKYFPNSYRTHQEKYFCNNANSALLKSEWQRFQFDEELTGLEDMALAKKIVMNGGKICYAPDAPVYHHHDETWSQVKRRYEREAIALKNIMPEVHLTFFDFLRYFLSGVFLDFGVAIQEKRFLSLSGEIIIFRFMQYWGAYRGNQEHRVLSRKQKEAYFYPKEV